MGFEHRSLSGVTVLAAHDGPTFFIGTFGRADERLLLKATRKVCHIRLILPDSQVSTSLCAPRQYSQVLRNRRNFFELLLGPWWGIILLFYQHFFSDWIAIVIFFLVQMLSLLSVLWLVFLVLPICFLLVYPKFLCPYSTSYSPSINQNVTLPVIDFVTCLGVTGTGMGVLSGSLLGAETQKGRKQSYGHNINASAIPTVSSCLQSTEEKSLRSLGALVC